jgi:hypothetical protein
VRSIPRFSADVRANPAVTYLPIAVVVLGIVKYGIGLHPEWRRFHDAANAWPQVWTAPLMLEGDRALLSNVTGAWIAGALSLGSIRWYLVFQIGLALLALILPFFMPRVRSALGVSRLMFIFIAGGPVTALLLSWAAGYDAVLVLAATVAVLCRNQWLACSGWLVLGLSHTAIALCMVLLWLPVMWVAERQQPQRRRMHMGAVGLAGVVVGGLIMRFLTDAWGGSTDRLSLFRAIPYDVIWTAYWSAIPLVVFSVLGIGWFVVFAPAMRTSALGKVLIAEAAFAALVLPLVVLDETRIAGLAMFAPVLAFVVAAPALVGAAEIEHQWQRLKWITALVPVLVIWEGAVLYAGMPATRAVWELMWS